MGIVILDVLVALALVGAWGLAGGRVGRLAARREGDRLRRTARSALALLILAEVLVAARLVLVGLLWAGSGWWFAADRVLLALPLLVPPALAALALAAPRLWRLARTTTTGPVDAAAWRAAVDPALVVPVRATALGAAIGAYFAAFAVPSPPYARPAMLLVALLAAAIAALWFWQRRRLALGWPGARAPERRGAHLLRAATLALVAALGVVTWGTGSALSSRLPARHSMTGHAQAGHDHGPGMVSVTTLTSPRDGAPDRRFTLTARASRVALSSGAVVDAWTFNGQLPGPELRFRQGELIEATLVNADIAAGAPVRLRLVNTDNNPRTFALTGAPFRVAAIDGTDVHAPGELRDARVELGGGAHYELTFAMPDGPVLLNVLRWDGVGLLLTPDGTGEPPAVPVGPTFDPAAYGTPAPTPFGASSRFDREFVQLLGQRFGFYNGLPTFLWTINGQVFPRTPTLMVREGELVKVTIANRSSNHHPMHLHGHHALVLSRDGRATSGSPWWVDTLNVAPGETYVIAFRADNPGVWMDHCHNLPHAARGMTMHLAYAGVTTPFQVGPATPNQPE